MTMTWRQELVLWFILCAAAWCVYQFITFRVVISEVSN